MEGGHRVGLCGTAVLRGGEIFNLRNLSSASVRVARQGLGAAEPVWDKLTGPDGCLESTLILAPPGAGKTTLLRDLIRMASDGVHMVPQRVGVADERGEIAALWNGRPQLAVGRRTDVLEGCPKAQGLMMLLRAMNPQILAADEVTAPGGRPGPGDGGGVRNRPAGHRPRPGPGGPDPPPPLPGADGGPGVPAPGIHPPPAGGEAV